MGSAPDWCTPYCKVLSWLKRQYVLTSHWRALSAKSVTTSLKKIGATILGGLNYKSSALAVAATGCIAKPGKRVF